MGYLLFILISIVLLVGFLILTAIEARRDKRVLASSRLALDSRIAEAEMVLNHVDFQSLTRESARTYGARLAHALAHYSLQLVRFVERTLTRAVRTLRPHAEPAISTTPPAQASEFANTMKDFKQELRNGRKPDEPV